MNACCCRRGWVSPSVMASKTGAAATGLMIGKRPTMVPRISSKKCAGETMEEERKTPLRHDYPRSVASAAQRRNGANRGVERIVLASSCDLECARALAALARVDGVVAD